MVSGRRKTLTSIAVLTVFVLLAWVAPGQTGAHGIDPEIRGGWQPGPDIYHPGRVIVRFSDALTSNAAMDSVQRLGYSVCKVASFEPTAAFPNGARFGIVEIPEGISPDTAVFRLSGAPEVLYAERDYIRYKYQVPMDAPVIPSDPDFAKLWGLNNEDCQFKDPRMPGEPVDDADIDAPEAWVLNTGSDEVLVAVIDTGCYIDHPDLSGNMWINKAELHGEPGVDDDGNGYVDDIWGWDWFNDDNSVFDPGQRDRDGYLNDEHGTHCAGTIGALANNSMGVVGVNWNVRIMSLKFIGPQGGYTSDAIFAFEYAADKGVQVANCSWGGGAYSQALKDAIEASGMLVVCAAGNHGADTDKNPNYPASYDSENIISVAAMMQNEKPCNYPGWWSTCYGRTTVDLFAPGGYILSTIPPDPPPSEPGEAYAFFYGTSMATPHVSGAAALLLGMYPDIPPAPGKDVGEHQLTIKDLILGGVDVFPQYEGLVATAGRLNVKNAIIGGGLPIIKSVEATPQWGAAPLEVNFRAAVASAESEIADQWWDFGDESELVHDLQATHTYDQEGMYTASFHVVDGRGGQAVASLQIHVFTPPVIDVGPREIRTELNWGETIEEVVTISNSGEGNLEYTVQLELVGMVDTSASSMPVKGLGSAGPDEYGYFWTDSDEPGVDAPEWFDISEIGIQVTLGGDDCLVVDLPFDFPFYGQTKNSICISSNGYLTFGSEGRAWYNRPIPFAGAPNDLIAVFWQDLEPQLLDGKVFYYSDSEKFVVQYEDIHHYQLASGGPYTFQATLTPAGTITYHYRTMMGERLDEATIGIENASGSGGVQVAYNEPYVHDDLAVYLAPAWVSVDKVSGTVLPGQSETLAVRLAAHHLPEGTWNATIHIHSNDPANPHIEVGTFTSVHSLIPPMIQAMAAEPRAGSAPLNVRFSAEAEDIDGEIAAISWDFGDGTDPVTGDLSPVHTYIAEGEYTATLSVTDDDGFTAEDTIVVVVADMPQATVDPSAFNQVMRAHRQRSETLTVTNTGEAPLVLTAKAITRYSPEEDGEFVPLSGGGPDGCGYLWRDSDEPDGPVFEWIEISDIGTRLDELTLNATATIDLPWPFPFYEEEMLTVNVNSNGWLNFGDIPLGETQHNKPIPTPALPNSLLAVYWDMLYPGRGPEGAGVYYHYDEVGDRLIVQFNKVPRFNYLTKSEYTFQVILYPDGTIDYQYLKMYAGAAIIRRRGAIGIENADGTDGLQVLYNTAGYMRDGLAIRFKPHYWVTLEPKQATLDPGESIDLSILLDLGHIGSGTLDGAIILKTNDLRKPTMVVPVHVDIIPNNAPIITLCGVNPEVGPVTTDFQFMASAHDTDGHIVEKWWSFGDGSAPVHEFVATHTYSREGRFTAKFTVVDNDGYEATESVTVTVREPASANWNPNQFSFALGRGRVGEEVLTLSNSGAGELIFGAEKLPARVEFLERAVATEDIEDLCARTAEGIYEPDALPGSYPWLPEGVGSVVTSWKAPSPIGIPWGVGVLHRSGDLVIADPGNSPTVDHVVTAEGVHTGTSWTANFGGDWAGDMAFDGKYVWQVNVGGDNAIYKIDPNTGQAVGSIHNSAWAGVPQRGLAHNANDDTFYIGGWNEDVIYKFKGESWANPGEVIDSWSMPVSIAGLAYHPIADVLAVTSNSAADTVYFVDPDSHAVLLEFPHPGADPHTGAGCEFAPCGNLWAASQKDGYMYLIETGLGPILAKWLTWEPTGGSVPAGGSVGIVVKADASELKPGEYEGKITLFTNDIENPMIAVPVTLAVTVPPTITESGVSPRIGEPPLEVAFHAAFAAPEIPVASYGWDFGDGQSSSELDVTHVYNEPGNYIACFAVVDEMGARAEAALDIEVKWLPRATVDPETIEVCVTPNGRVTETVTVGNVKGNADLEFEARIAGSSAPLVLLPSRIGVVADENAMTAEGLYSALNQEFVESVVRSVGPGTVGDVIMSWPAPSQISVPWGLGFDGNVWISDPLTKTNHVVTPDGAHTGKVFSTAWARQWAGDMAYDANRNLMWQVNVGGDNGIYGLNPESGSVAMRIRSGGPWVSEVQRGLGYDAATDTFYIAGWNEDIIYHIMGPSWSTPGAVISAHSFPVGIAGLEYHPDGVLWVASNGYPDMIYALDAETWAVIYEFRHPYGGDLSGAGLALNTDGNLWVASQVDKRIYLVNTKMPLYAGVTIDPRTGVVPMGETAELQITIDAADFGGPGDDIRQYLQIWTDDPEKPVLNVEIMVHIEGAPTIVEASAAPSIGEPPLKVAFAASVEPGGTPIADMWWNFGDGSDPVHELNVEHIYTDVGTYEASVHAIDENGVEASEKLTVTVKWLPVLGIEPEAFDVVIPVGREEQAIMSVENTGKGPMEFHILATPRIPAIAEWAEYAASEPDKDGSTREPHGFAGAGAGGPDQFGYIWTDSNHVGGPKFDWFEIRDIGTRLPLSDESFIDVVLPFSFPFYGEMKTKVRVCSNGYLTFQTAGSKWINTPIPDPSDPNDMIAVFWDDLWPGKADCGDVYWHYDEEGHRFIVEYWAVPSFRGLGDYYTFQAILYPNGTIVFQYLEMTGDLASATVGIENATGTDGLQVVCNAPYIEDGMAIGLAPVGPILGINPTSGYLVPGGRQDVVLTFGSPDVAYGTYSLYLYVSADDPHRPFAAIPVTLKVNAGPVVEIAAPRGGDELHGTCEITWTATDPDDQADTLTIDLYWSRGDGEWNEIARGLANTASYMWNTAQVGLGGDGFLVRIVVTDPAGETAEAISEQLTILNDAPVAEFSFSPETPTISDLVEFVDESTDDGTIAAWHWDFGDGHESVNQNPKHQYTAKGKFTVKLTVADDGGLTAVCEKEIRVVNVVPEVKILKPELGAIWTGARTIEYEATDADGDSLAVRLEYDYLGDQAGWQLIADQEENTGSYLWDTSKLPKGGFYKVRVTATDPDNGIGQDESEEFMIVVLSRRVVAAPNPARSLVTFYYDIEADGQLCVYDVAGRLVYSAELSAAANAHEWNVMAGDRPVASGLYLYVIVTNDGERSEVGRLVIER